MSDNIVALLSPANGLNAAMVATQTYMENNWL